MTLRRSCYVGDGVQVRDQQAVLVQEAIYQWAVARVPRQGALAQMPEHSDSQIPRAVAQMPKHHEDDHVRKQDECHVVHNRDDVCVLPSCRQGNAGKSSSSQPSS